jgi:excisionase family DNA binding protein
MERFHMTESIGTRLPKWAPVQQTATYLGVDERTVRRYIASGRLDARRIGPRLIRVDRDSVEKMMRPVGGAA